MYVHTRYEGTPLGSWPAYAAACDFVTVFAGTARCGSRQGAGRRPAAHRHHPVRTVNVLRWTWASRSTPSRQRPRSWGKKRRIDVGYMNGEPFLLMVSTGLDALAVHNGTGDQAG